MGVKVQGIKDMKMNRDGNLESFVCEKCKCHYRNPLMQNNFREFDKGVEVRMACDGIQIKCTKCNVVVIEVTP